MEKKDDNNNNVTGVENKNSTSTTTTTLTERPRYAVKLETLDSNSDVSANSSDVDQDEEEEEEDAAQYDEFTDVSARSDDNFSAAKPAVPAAASTTPTPHYQKNQTKSSKSLRRATPAAAAEPEPDLYSRAKIDYASSLALNTMDIFDPNKAVCAECRRLDYLSPCQVHCELQVCEVCVQKHLQIELNEFIRIKSFLESSVNEIRRNLSYKRSLCNENIKSSIQMKKFINMTLQQIKRKIELELENKRDELMNAVDTFMDNQKKINMSINEKTFQTTERICTEIDNLILMPDEEISPVKLKSLKAFARSYALKLKKQKAAKIPFYSIFFVPDSNIKIESPFGKIVLKSHDYTQTAASSYADRIPGNDELDLSDVNDAATDVDNISLLDEQIALNHTFQNEVAFLSDQKHFDTTELFSDKELAQMKANVGKTTTPTPILASAALPYARSSSLSTSQLSSVSSSSLSNLATPSLMGHLASRPVEQPSGYYSGNHYYTARRPLHYAGARGVGATSAYSTSTSELASGVGCYATLKTKINGQETEAQRILLTQPIPFPCDNKVEILPYNKPIEPMQISLLKCPTGDCQAASGREQVTAKREPSVERGRPARTESKSEVRPESRPEPSPAPTTGSTRSLRESLRESKDSGKESKESTDSEDLKDSSSESVKSESKTAVESSVRERESAPTPLPPSPAAETNSSFVPSHILLAQIGQTPPKRPPSVKVINRPGSYKPQAPTASSAISSSSSSPNPGTRSASSFSSAPSSLVEQQREEENVAYLPPRSPPPREEDLTAAAQSAIKTVKPVKVGLKQRLMKLGPRLVNF